MPVGARPARRRRHRHPPLVRTAPPLGAPGGGPAPTQGRGPRRGELGRRLRPPLEPGPRRPPRRPRPRAHHPAAGLRRGGPQQAPLAGPRVRGVVGPGRGPRPGHGPRPTPASGASSTPSTRSSTRSRPSPGTASTTAMRCYVALREHQRFGSALLQCVGDELDLLDLLLQGAPKYRKGCGKAPSWRHQKDAVHGQLATVRDAIDAARASVLDRCAHHLGSALRRHTLEAADARRAAGRARVPRPPRAGPAGARAIPSRAPTVRASLHQRYRRLLLDEFQDTDPIQIELAVRIAAARPRGRRGRSTGPTSRSTPVASSWSATRSSRSTGSAAPTSPPSSRPRRGSPPRAGGAVELTANFRTVEPIIDWVNHTFAALLAEETDTEVPHPVAARLRGAAGPAAAGADRPAGGRGRHRGAPAPDPRRRGAHGRERRCGQRDHHGAGRAVAGAPDGRWRRDVARLPPRRRHDPGARPHVTAVPRGGPRRRPHPLPGRVQLARLRHPRGARPADGPAGGRRPHRPPPHRVGAAHAAAGLRRRRPLPPQGRAAAARGPTTRPSRPTPPTASCSAGLAFLARPPPAPPLGSPPPSCSTTSPGSVAPSSSASPRAAPGTSGGGCAS